MITPNIYPLSEAQKFSTHFFTVSPFAAYTNPTFSSSRRSSLTYTTAPVGGREDGDYCISSPSLSASSDISTFPVANRVDKQFDNSSLPTKLSFVSLKRTILPPPPSLPPPILSSPTPSSQTIGSKKMNALPSKYPPSIPSSSSSSSSSVILRRASLSSTDSCIRCDNHHHHHNVPVGTVRSVNATAAAKKEPAPPPKLPTETQKSVTVKHSIKEDLLNEINQLNALIQEEQKMEYNILSCINRAQQTNVTFRQRHQPVNTVNNYNGNGKNPSISSILGTLVTNHTKQNTNPSGMMYRTTNNSIHSRSVPTRHSIELLSPSSLVTPSTGAVRTNKNIPQPRSSIMAPNSVSAPSLRSGTRISNNYSSSIFPSLKSENILELLQNDREEIIYELLHYPKQTVLDHLYQQIQILQQAQYRYESRK